MPVECSVCICDTSIPEFEIGSHGICNFCEQHHQFDEQYPIDVELLINIAQKICSKGRNKPFDCVVGISGGCDSSYLLYRVVKLGLRPLAVHYDNGWNYQFATRNMKILTKALNVPLEIYRVNVKEMNDIWKSFLQASVPDIEAPTDIGLTTVLYKAAEKHGIKYILEGHSFRTEGIIPTGVSYMDGRYIANVHKRYGTIPIRTFPNLWLSDWMRWLCKGIRRLRPLYYMNYRKKDASKLLYELFGWQPYPEHHGDNLFTAFFQYYFRRVICKIDVRKIELSALIRSGHITKEEAQEKLNQKLVFSDVEFVRKRLNIAERLWNKMLENSPPLFSHLDYETYKTSFKHLRWFFWLMYKWNRVPKTFYEKYCR